MTKQIFNVLWLCFWLLTGGELPLTIAHRAHEEIKPMRYLVLGDSYTIGEGMAVPDRWPVQLVSALRTSGVTLDDPQIIARTGWTTAELIDAIEQQSPQGPFDLVSLLIGVNNQFRGRSQTEYRTEFRALLHTAIAFAADQPNHVIVLSIPDWGATPFATGRDRAAIAEAIDQFNAINRAESEQAGVHYVDVTSISRQALADPTLVADDELHPSAKMYTLWVEQVAPVASAMLGAPAAK